MGIKRFSLAMAREWPWAARMRYWEGSTEGLEVGFGVVVEGSGMRVKRCLSFWVTIWRSSGKVTFREWRRCQESWGGVGWGGQR